MFIADNSLWQIIRDANPYNYPRRLIALYAEYLLRFDGSAFQYSPFTSEPLAVATTVIWGMQNEGSYYDLLARATEREHNSEHYMDVPRAMSKRRAKAKALVTAEDPRLDWTLSLATNFDWFDRHTSYGWYSFAVLPQNPTWDDFKTSVTTTLNGWNVAHSRRRQRSFANNLRRVYHDRNVVTI